MNYCINAAWHEGNQTVALLGVMEAQVALIAVFRSSALLGLVSVILYFPRPCSLNDIVSIISYK